MRRGRGGRWKWLLMQIGRKKGGNGGKGVRPAAAAALRVSSSKTPRQRQQALDYGGGGECARLI